MHLKIDKSWTLFLDRDGVINKRLPGDYVKAPEQFIFIEGVLEAFRTFSSVFKHIIVVTNQQGIGKGLMTTGQLDLIHNKMMNEITLNGGRVDGIFYAPALDSQGSFLRKPSVGMGLLARKQFKDILFKKSVMAGDSVSDMIFGNRLGMKTVLIGDCILAKQHPELVDFVYPDLLTFANTIDSNIKLKS
ncbi:histidinol-phosphate phosphatase family domain [Lentimicrobium saccharophilum]|uniref:D,D-heptose 1,7-bisphosphate phosphatase n=1 Tax=Lentimicrobium saccharophilum TaxID=1678841 RepID=A0A0S7BTY9_9BACT|nr:HAD-IIIA family hydrolase [Lentimicrobium saccharophilum]GAP44364.1 histidinol-phosphate phosphatase family domain [Lentimicrobium saccharophilum]